jgi:hypothetical protein
MAAQTKQTKLHPKAHARLLELQTGLSAQGLPGKIDQASILSALVLYTTPPQLAGMLQEYARYTATPDTGPPDES